MLMVKWNMIRTRQVTVILEATANSAASFVPSTSTQKSLVHSTLQWLNNFSCLGALTRCTSDCLGSVSLLQPQQSNHLRNKEVQKHINSRSFSLKIFIYLEQQILGRISYSSRTHRIASEVNILPNTSELKLIWMLLILVS